LFSFDNDRIITNPVTPKKHISKRKNLLKQHRQGTAKQKKGGKRKKKNKARHWLVFVCFLIFFRFRFSKRSSTAQQTVSSKQKKAETQKNRKKIKSKKKRSLIHDNESFSIRVTVFPFHRKKNNGQQLKNNEVNKMRESKNKKKN